MSLFEHELRRQGVNGRSGSGWCSGCLKLLKKAKAVVPVVASLSFRLVVAAAAASQSLAILLFPISEKEAYIHFGGCDV